MLAAWRNMVIAGVAIALVIAAASFWNATSAQQPPQPPQPSIAPQPPQAPLAARLALGQVAITANNEFVYVVRGNTLYQFSARTLDLVKSVQLPLPRDIRLRPFGAEDQQQFTPQRPLRRRQLDPGQSPQ